MRVRWARGWAAAVAVAERGRPRNSALAGELMTGVSTELASQLLTLAVVGKKRTLGNWMPPQALPTSRCWSANSMRPSVSLRATMRISSPDQLSLACVPSSTGELASQLLTPAVVGKKRTWGRVMLLQAPPRARSWKPNSTRPSSSFWATMRASMMLAWPATGEATTVPPRTARAMATATKVRRLRPDGPEAFLAVATVLSVALSRSLITESPLRNRAGPPPAT